VAVAAAAAGEGEEEQGAGPPLLKAPAGSLAAAGGLETAAEERAALLLSVLAPLSAVGSAMVTSVRSLKSVPDLHNKLLCGATTSTCSTEAHNICS